MMIVNLMPLLTMVLDHSRDQVSESDLRLQCLVLNTMDGYKALEAVG